MSRMLIFFVFAHVWGSLLASFLAGETALAASPMTAAIDSDATSLTVESTSGFLQGDILVVDNEIIEYSAISGNTFTGLVRGTQESDATSHAAGIRVYSETGGFLNQFLSFNVLETLADDGFFKGGFKVLVQLPLTMISVLAKVISWDFTFLDGHGAPIKYLLLYPLSVGLIFAFVQLVFRRGTS